MHSIEMVTMAVLGGAGSVLGAILGATILTLLPQVLTVFQQYEQIMLGLVMMLVMIFMRDGLLPSIAARVRGRGEGVCSPSKASEFALVACMPCAMSAFH